MILFGSSITASEAASWGLVSQVCAPGTVLSNAIRIATQLTGQSSSAVALAKKAITAAVNLGIATEVERGLYYSAFSSVDKIEGVAAFLGKREPEWV